MRIRSEGENQRRDGPIRFGRLHVGAVVRASGLCTSGHDITSTACTMARVYSRIQVRRHDLHDF